MLTSQLTSLRPYLLRACYEWLLDNNLTPHLVVDINMPGVMVPLEYASDGHIVLNIAPRAVGNLKLGNEDVRFSARFGGVPHQVFVPIMGVLAIYARENGAGTMFEREPNYYNESNALVAREQSSKIVMSVIDGDHPDKSNIRGQNDYHSTDTDDEPPPRRSRPALHIVK